MSELLHSSGHIEANSKLDTLDFQVTTTCFLRTSIPWFGTRSGYEQLTSYINHTDARSIVAPVNSYTDRLIGRFVSLFRGYGHAPQSAIAALRRFESRLAAADDAVGHILYGDDFIRFIPRSPAALVRRMVLTFHQPPSQWPSGAPPQLDRAPAGIVLYSRHIDFFARMLGRPPAFILHGVDADFFCPTEHPPPPRRVLFSGVHLRDIPMLRAVVEALSRDVSGLQFDFLVPIHRRDSPDLRALAELPSVTWHAGLSDEQLRALYQSSALLLLPMTDSGANTAVVEALASGLPVVTTDVGGIRDYGGDSVFPLVRDGDVNGMVALAERYLESPALMNHVRMDSRRFAESRLNWPLIARQHVELYDQIRRKRRM